MNTTAANILVTAQARQAQAVLARAQAALRGLQSTAQGANAAQATAANAAAKQIDAAEARKASAAAKASLAIEQANLRQIKSEQAASVAAARSAAAISLSQTKAAGAAEASAAKQAAAAAKMSAAMELSAMKQQAAMAQLTLVQMRQLAQMEAASARQIAADNRAAMSAAKSAAQQAAARESLTIATLRAVAREEAASARKIAADARAALQAQVLANAETGNQNRVVTARLRAAAQTASANAAKINSDNGAAIAAEVAANREMRAAREASLADMDRAMKAQAANARKAASDAQAAVNAQANAIKEAAAMSVADTARIKSAAVAAAENARKIASDAAVANTAAMTAGRESVANAQAAASARIGAQQKVVADAQANASRMNAAAVAAAEASKIAAAEARAAAAAEKAAIQITAAKQREIAANSAATASNRSWSASMTASGSRMQWIGRQLSQNFTAPMLLATGIGVKFGLDMEKSMTRLEKVYADQALIREAEAKGINLVKNETEALEKAFIALSNKYGVQADEVANVAAEWAAAGASGKALATQTDLTMKTMVLGEMDAEEATKALIAIQAQWGAVTETNLDQQNKLSLGTSGLANDQLSLTSILRQLNAVENETGTTMNDLVVAFSRASGVARSAGFDTAHLAAAVAALVPAAGSAAEAGNALKTIISRTLTPTREASQIMELMQIQTEKAAWQSMNAGQRLEELAKRFGTLTGAQKAQVAASLGSRYQVNKLEVLFSSIANKAGYYHKALEKLANEADVVKIAEDELNTVLESQPQMLKQAGVIIQNSLMKTMVPLIPVVIQITQWIGKAFDAFANLPTGVRTTLIGLGLFLATVGPIIIFLGIFKLALGQLTPVFLMLARAMLFPITIFGKFGALLLKPIMGLAKLRAALALTARAFALIPAAAVLMTRIVSFALMGMQATVVVGMAGLRASWTAAWVAMVAVQTVSGVAMTTTQKVMFMVMLTAQKVWAGASLLIQRAWATASVAVHAAWGAAAAMVTAVGQAIMLARQRAWAAAWLAITVGWATASLLLQKTWAAASILLSGAYWKRMFAIFAAGNKGLLAILAAGGKAIVALFSSPWAIAIAIVIGLIVMFREQIAQAWNNVVNYFRNIPKETSAALSPLTNIFVRARNAVVGAFNSLPEGVKGALLKVVAIVRAAAMKVYELFSYLNPFARHSPSLVENVTNGMAVVNAQFANASRNAQKHVGQLHKSINKLQSLSAPMTAQNDKAKDDEFRQTATKAGAASSLPAYDALNADVKAAKSYMDQLNKSMEAHEAQLKNIKAGVEAYDAAIEQMNSALEVTKAIQSDVNRALDGAKARFDRYSNAQIKGTRAAEDAIFDNEMAQKRLQLQIAKMEEEAGTVDSVTDSYSKLQGEIESLTAKQTELRKAGAGSDVLGTYDKMIADLKSQQSGLMTGGTDSPAGKIAALNTSLQALQKQADIMDLEKSLKFDSLNRKIEQFSSNVEEMPYGQIMSGMDSSRTSINALQYSYDQLDMVMAGQQARIDATQAQRDALQQTYDSEAKRLETVRAKYEEVEQAVRSGEEALESFSSASEEVVRRQEEAARAAEEASKKLKKKKGGGAGSGDELTPGAQNFIDGAAGDFETFGGTDTIGREGAGLDQSSQIDEFTKGLTDDLEKQLGGLNPFSGLKNAWNRTVNWFKGMMPGFGDIFKNVGNGIGSAFSSDKNENVKRFGDTISKGVESLRNIWGWIQKVGQIIGKLFGPDLQSTMQGLGDGFKTVMDKISGPLSELGKTVMPFLQTAFTHLMPVIALFVGALEVVWEVINGAIGPVFSWLGDIIGAVITVITGIMKVFMGLMKVIQGVVMVVVNILKGIFTFIKGLFSLKFDLSGFGGIGEALKKIFGGFGDMFGGIVDIVKGIFVAIWSTIKNSVKLIWNVVWGLVKGIIDFFKTLWDVLVGHSIVPDTINSIIDWFKELPGKLPGMVWGLITSLIGFFLKMPIMIGQALLKLGGFLFGAFTSAMAWLLPKLPGFIWNIVKFFATLPFKIIGALVGFGAKLLGWLGQAIAWLVPQLPGIVWDIITFFATLPFKIIGALLGFGAKLFEWAKNAFIWLAQNLPGVIGNVISFFAGLPGKLIGALLGLGSKLFEWAKNGFIWLAQNLPNAIGAVLDFAKEFPGRVIRGFGKWGSFIWEWMKKGWDFLVNEMPGIVAGFLKWIGGIPGMLLGKLGDGAKVLYDYGKDMIQGLMNGTAGLLKKLGDWFLDKIPGWIKTPFKKALGIASPSKVFAGYGVNIGEGLVKGIGSMEGQVEQASIAMAAAADKGEVGGMAISAVADTSSVGGSVSALGDAVAASGPVAVDTAAEPTADIQPMLDAAEAAFDAFDASMQTKMAAFTAAVTLMFAAMVTGILSSLDQVTIGSGTSFAAMQATVVGIVTAMVAAVQAQLALLISHVTQFGLAFTAAWAEAWNAWKSETSLGVDHTLSEWERMAQGMRDIFDGGIAPIFEDMAKMYTTLEGATKTTVDNVGTTWADIEPKTKRPAGIVINEVYNNGLRGAWNKFNSFLGVAELPAFTVAYATGGPVHGPGTETSDSIYAKLSRGEHVITAAEVRGAGGHQAIMAQRQVWAGRKRMQGVDQSMPAFARGGPVDPKAPPWPGESNLKPAAILARRNIHKYWPMIGEIGGYRPSDPYPDHPSGLALDVMVGVGNPVGDEVNDWLHRNMVPLALNYTIWKQFYKPAGGGGNLMGDRGDPTQNHMDHVHALFNNNGVPGITTGGIGGSSGGAPIDYKKIVQESFKADMDEVRKNLPAIPGGIGQWPKISADVAEKMALKKLLPLAEKMSISSGSAASAWAGAPDASVVTKVKEAMKTYGWDQGAEWEALNQLIGHESSWNPNAQNPSSTAYGLFQFLDSTWASVGGSKTSDPYQQAIYGGRYIKNRYGSPSAAWAFWQNPQPNPYGGNWYDNGGVLPPGLTLANNQTGGPEAILTAAQWSAMFDIATKPPLDEDTIQGAVEAANIATGNTDDATTAAIMKGMDVWSAAWTPAMVDSTDAATAASEKVADAADKQSSSTVLLSKSLGKYDQQIASLSKVLTAFSNSAQQSVKVTVNVTNGTATTGNTSTVGTNEKGEQTITVEQPTFEQWAPTLNALADFFDTLPYAERDWLADNPVAGETEQQRKMRLAQNNLTNFAKGGYNVLRDVGPVMLRHTAIIGTAVERLVKEDGPAWSAALAAIASNNPAGYAVAVMLVLKEVATLLPLILAAIMDIVPALIRAIVRFLTQFMPDSVFAYADMAAAEAAVTEQQAGGAVAMGQGQRYPTDAMSTTSGNESITLNMYGDLVMPNVSDGSDANDFVEQLKLLAAGS
ncbi:tail length tape measure protein [Gordonia phage BirksAndSocks]|uniref:Tape measure protein n=1 Tax=Gordonia phage BirksAndSocks TaxID=2047831 RepID=A0A2H4YDI3_9CAUD|nr:tail length tape measure protein [Gordonia phage BirksAndSocks]AUE22142.1 tape measure protein [Gordonia phage BirksAndSocks]